MADGQNLLDRKHGAISIVGGRGELGTVCVIEISFSLVQLMAYKF